MKKRKKPKSKNPEKEESTDGNGKTNFSTERPNVTGAF